MIGAITITGRSWIPILILPEWIAEKIGLREKYAQMGW